MIEVLGVEGRVRRSDSSQVSLRDLCLSSIERATSALVPGRLEGCRDKNALPITPNEELPSH